MFRYRKPLLFLIHGSDKIKISLNCSIRIVLFSCVLNLKIKGSFQRNRKETGIKGRHPWYDLFFFQFCFLEWIKYLYDLGSRTQSKQIDLKLNWMANQNGSITKSWNQFKL